MGKLISIELFNFKSYRGHHTLLFGDSYFTSIIGPNGSGKSNSMDAISFVLGIKSSHLRSTHLRDLIYRGRVLRTSRINADGTATEAPETADDDDDDTQRSSQRGDPTTAWVQAVYEDDAGEEQRWKRTITAQGASEYRINNQVVSAQQYNAALEAENILIKARNFLVFQGDVEAIASQAPKDLTLLIEQISGSLEYKKEYERLKAENEKAADELNFRLNQRRAINGEIKQYQEQKAEADNFERKRAERDQAIVTHVLWKLFHFQRTMEESGEQIRRNNEELKEHKRGLEKFEQRLEEAKREQGKVAREVGKMERAIKRKEKEIEDKENSLVPLDEKISISSANRKKYEARIKEVEKERDAQQKNVNKLKKDLDTVQKAQKKWEDEWAAQQQAAGRELSEADLQEYNRLRSEVTRRTASDQTRLDHMNRQLKTDAETVASLRSKVESAEAQVSKLESEIQDLKERRATMDAQTKSTQKEIEAKKRDFDALTSERLRSAQKQTELEEKLQEVLTKLISADSDRRTTEKEHRAKETVAAMKRIFPGVRGRISDLSRPKQKKYETAVSTVLGRHFDAIVVDTERTARDCIQYLRDQRAGQATFIPLDTIQVKAVDPSLKTVHRGARLAIDIIDYDAAYERAMSYACGNALVCDDLSIAKALVYDRGIEVKAVTLDGTIIHKGGLMTGGRGPQDRQRRWEDTEVENLRRLRDKLLADIAALPRGHRRGTEEEQLQGELAGLESQLNFSREEVRALDRNIASKESELAHARQQLEETRPKLEEQSAHLEELRSNLQTFADAIARVEDEVFAEFCQRLGYADIRAYEKQQGTMQQEASQKKLEFTRQRSRIENQLAFETQRLATTTARIQTLRTQDERDANLIASLNAEKESINNELDTLNAELEQLKQQLETLRQRADERAGAVNEARREVAKRNKNVDETLKTIVTLEAEVTKCRVGWYNLLRKCRIDEVNIPLAEGSEPLESLPLDETINGTTGDAMELDGEEGSPGAGQATEARDYGIIPDFDELDDDLKEDDSPKAEERLQERIQALNAELDKMAPNMRAVDRLEATSARLHSTEKDFQAARRAAARAKEAFEEVRERRAELFNKAFQHISDQIGPVYKELTRSTAFPLGGQAYLDLEEGDDAEEAFLGGVKYHATPPLKRFRDLSHLSGGEKTIAALALLFAIHSYSPSPFFVLDEVDAALDSVNVRRVAEYLRRASGPATTGGTRSGSAGGMQFIVISLKQGLFGESETLVGVARDQARMSSRTVTLDLRKYQAV
ncbi:Structural maintenance of chromosomes protein 1 [Coniosporium apollinis]|uniref:Structural maintenance of chromosomes protein n=1 Tax=Coniosporium apollinis TaxID=61459 RepID=A0ABQ9NSW1_9PEZI|nr:Structural maintenance of chromosomes protein 1 [Coniosporium apollinis]